MFQNLKTKILTEVFKLGVTLNNVVLQKIKLKPENLICRDLHENLLKLFVDDKVKGIWAHIQNEGTFSKNPSFSSMYVLRLVGKAVGFPDYVFLWENNCALIEMKAGKPKLSSAQVVFQDWAKEKKINHFVCCSAEDALNKLKEVGFISD
jgi:hypothetical protein